MENWDVALVTGTHPDLFATYHGPIAIQGGPADQPSFPRLAKPGTTENIQTGRGDVARLEKAPVLEQAERPWRQPAHAGDRPMERGDSSTILTLRPDLRYKSKLATPSVANPNVADRGLRPDTSLIHDGSGQVMELYHTS